MLGIEGKGIVSLLGSLRYENYEALEMGKCLCEIRKRGGWIWSSYGG